jgi:hypothetical protein
LDFLFTTIKKKKKEDIWVVERLYQELLIAGGTGAARDDEGKSDLAAIQLLFLETSRPLFFALSQWISFGIPSSSLSSFASSQFSSTGSVSEMDEEEKRRRKKKEGVSLEDFFEEWKENVGVRKESLEFKEKKSRWLSSLPSFLSSVGTQLLECGCSVNLLRTLSSSSSSSSSGPKLGIWDTFLDQEVKKNLSPTSSSTSSSSSWYLTSYSLNRFLEEAVVKPIQERSEEVGLGLVKLLVEDLKLLDFLEIVRDHFFMNHGALWHQVAAAIFQAVISATSSPPRLLPPS